MTVDGKTVERAFLKYGKLLEGAKVRFDKQPEPNNSRGTKAEDAPCSMSNEKIHAYIRACQLLRNGKLFCCTDRSR